MSRMALLGCTFVAVLFFVCVGYFISHKPLLPGHSSANENAAEPKPASNSNSTAPESVPATAPSTEPAVAPAPSASTSTVTAPEAKAAPPEPEETKAAPSPPSKRKPSPEPTASIPSGNSYAVDLGSFLDRNNADRLAANIPKNYQTTITQVEIRGRLFYRVRTIVPTQTDAAALAAKLAREQKLEPRITPIQNP